ncbi:MAG: type II toxin-antitoxin system RelE/ParE family toxin [Candidatus Liptonbacteria bacterium]|nr:type II toxin-antitoxin system RelE/ParE family toxin [Candidatus Liptonbacteria bacterium]
MLLKILRDASNFIETLSDTDAAKILAHLNSLEHKRLEALQIKTLHKKIKELIVFPYRIVFFEIDGLAYVTDIFRKKSQKTPPRIIERAVKIYQSIIK